MVGRTARNLIDPGMCVLRMLINGCNAYKLQAVLWLGSVLVRASDL